MSRNHKNRKKNRKAYLAEVRAMDSSITMPSNNPAPATEATETADEDDHKVINLGNIMSNPASTEHADELYESIVKDDPPASEETAEIPKEHKTKEEPTEVPPTDAVESAETADPPACEKDTEESKVEESATEDPPAEKAEEHEDPVPESAEVPEEPAATPAPIFNGGDHEDTETEFGAETMVAVRTVEIPESYSPPTLGDNPIAIPPIGAMGFEEKITPQEAGVVINRLQDELISSLRSDISMIRDAHEKEIAAIMDKHRMEMDTLNTSIGELRTQHDAEISQQSAEYQANLESINKQNATELARQRDELNAQIKDQKQHFEELLRKERAEASKRINQAQAEADERARKAEAEAAAARGDERISGLQQENDTLKNGYAALYKILSGIKAELEAVNPDVRMKPILSDTMIEDVCSSIQMVKYKYDRNDIANIIDRAIWSLQNMKGSEAEMQNMRRAVRYAMNIIDQANIR